MGLPRYKEWMGERNRLMMCTFEGLENLQNLRGKLPHATSSPHASGAEMVNYNLLRKWSCISLSGLCWNIPEKLPTTKNMQLEDKLSESARSSDPIDDACSVVHGLKRVNCWIAKMIKIILTLMPRREF